MSSDLPEHYDVVILGAGMAGLATGRVLAESGLTVLVLEARDRIGGRILTLRTGGPAIEQGAEFIHGKPPELWTLIEEAGLETYEREGDFLQLHAGVLIAQDDADDDGILDALEDFPGPDRPFAQYLAGLTLSDEEAASETGYVEGFNAADAQEASVIALGRQQAAEDAIDGDRLWKLRDGYDRLPAFLLHKLQASGGKIKLSAKVEAVAWASSNATIMLTGGRIFTAAKLVVTVPLGVLHAESIAFTPRPTAILDAAKTMRMGHVCRFTIVFRKRLWPERMSFLLTQEDLPSIWWSSRPADELTLTGWVGGPSAHALLALDARELQGRAIESLTHALALGVDEIQAAFVAFHTRNWTADEFSRGAYSWVPVGGLEASRIMSEPLENTLFFAGEHTDTTGHWGTVHAAYGSGLRAARQILETTSKQASAHINIRSTRRHPETG